MGRIFVCGDTHHDNDIAKLQPQNFTIQKDLIVDKQNLINKENKKVNKYKTTSIISIGLLILTLLFK